MKLFNSEVDWYYLLSDGTKLYSKIAAIEYATTNNCSISFYYGDREFSSHNWMVEPQESLAELYKRRAQQIRDEYDYLILMYSSGSDSQNLLRAFNENNIHIDEIVMFGSFDGDKDKFANDKLDPTMPNWELYNLAPRTLGDLIIKPKITRLDFTRMAPNQTYTNKDWIYSTNFWTPNAFLFWNNLDGNIPKYKGKVGIIVGKEKPRVIYENNMYYMMFIDSLNLTGASGSIVDKSIGNEHMVYFYSSPHAARLIMKQCHMIKHYMNMTGNQNLCRVEGFGTSEYNRHIIPVIYPTISEYSLLNKPPSNIISQRDRWFYQQSYEHRNKQIWLDGINYISNEIPKEWINSGKKKIIPWASTPDMKYANDLNDGLVGIVSKKYCIGS